MPEATYYFEPTQNGWVRNRSLTWSGAREALCGDVYNRNEYGYEFLTYTTYIVSAYYIYRGFMRVDTSGMPDDSTVQSAIIHLYLDPAGGTNNFAVQESTSGSTLLVCDYDAFTGNEFARTTSLTAGQYNTIELNGAGRASINRTGYSYFCFRDLFDFDNISSTGSHNVRICWGPSYGESQRPKLVVLYETGGSNSLSSSVRVVGRESKANPGSFTVAGNLVGDLSNSVTLRKAGSKGLSGSFYADWHDGSNALSASLTPRQYYGKLPASATVKKASSGSVSSSFTIRKALLGLLSGSFTNRKATAKAISASVSIVNDPGTVLSESTYQATLWECSD